MWFTRNMSYMFVSSFLTSPGLWGWQMTMFGSEFRILAWFLDRLVKIIASQRTNFMDLSPTETIYNHSELPLAQFPPVLCLIIITITFLMFKICSPWSVAHVLYFCCHWLLEYRHVPWWICSSFWNVHFCCHYSVYTGGNYRSLVDSTIPCMN